MKKTRQNKNLELGSELDQNRSCSASSARRRERLVLTLAAIQLEHRPWQAELIRLTHSLAAAVLVALLTATSALAQDISVRHSWSRATQKAPRWQVHTSSIENGGVVPASCWNLSHPAARKMKMHGSA